MPICGMKYEHVAALPHKLARLVSTLVQLAQLRLFVDVRFTRTLENECGAVALADILEEEDDVERVLAARRLIEGVVPVQRERSAAEAPRARRLRREH